MTDTRVALWASTGGSYTSGRAEQLRLRVGGAVSGTARYQRASQVSRYGDVITSRGVDAVTGLAVYIYDFPGTPRVKPGQLDSEAIPTVLAAGYDGTNGLLVTAFPPGGTKLLDSGATLDDDLVLQTLAALRDAARVGLVHGDIRPERFLLAHGRVYVEGYGVPWNPEQHTQPSKELIRAALTRDLVSATKALLEFGSEGLSTEVAAALRGALGSATRAGDAGQLYSVVRRLAGGAVTVPPAGFGNLVIPTSSEAKSKAGALQNDDLGLGSLDLDELDLSPQRPPSSQPVDDDTSAHTLAAEAARGVPAPELFEEEALPLPTELEPPTLTTPAFPDEPDPITLHSDPGPTLTVDQKLKDSGAGFVKDLPPGATYRAGNPEEAVRVPPIDLNVNAVPVKKKRGWRLPILVLALVLVAGFSAYLALVAGRDAPPVPSGTSAMSHFVDVRVEPSNLPPASLVVEQRPAASAFRTGTIIASVPRRVRFDAAGVWVVHATFQGRISESVTLRVPEDTSITIVFPADEPTDP